MCRGHAIARRCPGPEEDITMQLGAWEPQATASNPPRRHRMLHSAWLPCDLGAAPGKPFSSHLCLPPMARLQRASHKEDAASRLDHGPHPAARRISSHAARARRLRRCAPNARHADTLSSPFCCTVAPQSTPARGVPAPEAGGGRRYAGGAHCVARARLSRPPP